MANPGLRWGSSLSVLDVISLPPLNMAQVLTGRSALAYRHVRWLQVMHWPAQEFIRPGDLVLTTGVAPSAGAAAEFLEAVVQSDAAALIVSLPDDTDSAQVMESVTAVARRSDFPVLSLPWEVPFADVSRIVLTRLLAGGCQADETSCTLRHGGIRLRPEHGDLTQELSRAMALRADSADVEVALGQPGPGPNGEASFATTMQDLTRVTQAQGLQFRTCHRPGVALIVHERKAHGTSLRELLERSRESTGDSSSHWVISDKDGYGGGNGDAGEKARSVRVGQEIISERDDWVASQPLESLFVLGAMAQSPLISSVAADSIGPLVEYDRQHGRNLVETLQVFLDESCNTSAAARRLFLNRHSLMYRLRKIEELSGFSLKEPADRFFLQAIVRLYRYRLVEEISTD